jgi:hypothetical protein
MARRRRYLKAVDIAIDQSYFASIGGTVAVVRIAEQTSPGVWKVIVRRSGSSAYVTLRDLLAQHQQPLPAPDRRKAAAGDND